MSSVESIKGSPLVSIIMPAYNSEKYITDAICSVINQTYENWELLVLDDGSQDKTCKIVEELAVQDKRINLLPNKKNMGTAKTRNRGIDLSNGEFIALLDSDDIWYPDKLRKQLVLAQRTSADLVYCSYSLIGEDGHKTCGDYVVPDQVNLQQLLKNNVIGCSTVLLSSSAIKGHRFSLDYYHEDYVLWLELLRSKKKAVGLVEIAVDYRVHAGSRASNKLNAAKKRWEIYRSFMNLSLCKSVYYLIYYAVGGVKKYQHK